MSSTAPRVSPSASRLGLTATSGTRRTAGSVERSPDGKRGRALRYAPPRTMIATLSLAKEYGARVLFADVSLQLNAGSRYGLVGANGSGLSLIHISEPT